MEPAGLDVDDHGQKAAEATRIMSAAAAAVAGDRRRLTRAASIGLPSFTRSVAPQCASAMHLLAGPQRHQLLLAKGISCPGPATVLR